ncbi:MAG: hypothetical protein ACYCPH_00090 [Minisyncoccota bacterium]
MPPEQQLARARIENAEALGREAARYYNKTQEKVFDDIAKGLQQISLVAAGTISLSITFLGYVIEKSSDQILLVEHLLHIPILFILFGSWCLLLLSVILGLLYRLIHSWNWYALAGNAWAQHGIEVWDAHLAHNALGGVTIAPESPDTPLTREHMEKTKLTWIGTTNTFASHRKRYEFLLRWCRRITIGAFILGLLLLLIFVIVVAYNLAM